MKFQVKLEVGSNKTTTVHLGIFDTYNEDDGRLFDDLMTKSVPHEDNFEFINLSIRRLDDEGASEAAVQGSNLA